MKNRFTGIFEPLRIVLGTAALLIASGFSGRDAAVPIINDAFVDTITGTGFKLTVNVNLEESTVWWVVTESATAPTTAQIKLGDDENDASAADGGSINILVGEANTNQSSTNTIGGLNDETQYYIHFFAEDDNAPADQSSVETLAVMTADVTDPSITSAKAVDNTGTGFTFKVTVDDDGTVYYVVDEEGTTPSTGEITLHQNGVGAPADAFGTIVVSAGVEAEVMITGLTYPAGYNVYFFAVDDGTNESAVTTRSIPLLNSSSIPGPSVTGAQLDLRVSFDEKPVDVYYVVTTSATKPSSSQIFAELDAANGTPVAFGNFSYNPGTVGNDVDHTITGLDDNTTYYVHFYGADAITNESIVETQTATTDDATPPQLVTLSPADNATGVDYNLDKLVLTFDENVDNLTNAAVDATDRVIIYDATDTPVLTVDRVNVTASGSSTTAEITIPPGTLDANSDYYVKVGGDVIEDDPAGNNWPGISTSTAWNFSTSGVLVNNVTSDICSGSFQSIGDIVISEVASGDFITSGTIDLVFTDADFGFDISSVTVTAGPPGNTDITAIQVNPRTLTRLTLDFDLDGSNDKVDVITISGLKVFASSAGGTTIVNDNSTAGVWAISEPITFATINVGATAPAIPVLETAPVQDLLFCENEDISTATVAVQNDGGTFTWYNNSALSTPLASGFQVDVEAGLGINASVVGTVKRYVVRIDGCQSAPLEVEFEVAPVPVADAGAATATICYGSSVTLGGSPTLIGPSVSGVYQYLWSTNPPGGFTDLGPNPSVSPTPTNNSDTIFYYTVKIIDVNNCASDILDPNATIAVEVDSTDEVIVYNSPLSTSFTLNSDPIELNASPAISSSYSGNGIYLSAGKYYFDPDFAGTAGSPHAITYTTTLTNGCLKSEVRNFAVSNSSGSIVNLASSYCQNEAADPGDVLSLGPDWSNNLASNNAYYSANYGYTYEFYDFQTYMGTDVPGTGVVGTAGNPQYIDPAILQAYPYGSGTYAYVGMRVRRKYPELVLGIPTGAYLYDAPIFWSVQYVNIYPIPTLKVLGISSGQIICDVDEDIALEANFETGTYEISRDNVNWVSGPTAGIVDNPINSGKALFNPHNAYISSGFAAPNNTPAAGIANFYIRYTYVVPGTVGSNSSPCETTLVIAFQISNNPVVAWEPLAETEFCYEAADVLVETNPTTGISISGYGIFDNGNGTAFFNPDEALKAKAFATNNPPYTDYNAPEDIIISATRTDANGCFTTIDQTLQVRPLFPASFTESDLDVCYEDGTQNIVGAQPNGSYDLSHPNYNENFAMTTINGFNLQTYFDEAVANGADGTVSQKFNLTFNTFDPALGCSNSVTKQFSINPPIQMDIGGMTPGMIVCGNGTPFELTGNQPGAGSFQISANEFSGYVSNALGLNNTTSGKATYTPSGAGVPAGDPQKSLYIKYSFLGAGCTGTAETTEELIINPQPAITFSGSIPPALTQYCFEQAISPTTANLTTVENLNVTLSGFGMTDNGGGAGVFNPTSAYQQSSLADNLNPLTDQTIRNIIITATRSDAYSCVNSTNITYIVNPLPTATFAPGQVEFCYEDPSVILSGGQTNVSWQFIYKNTTAPPNYSPAEIFQSTTPFDPKVIFDDAVSLGANGLATLQFDVIYTAINNTTGCTNEKAPITFTVSPKIPVEIAGVDQGEIFCSNITDKELEFNPPDGIFRINGLVEDYDLVDQKYVFNPPISGPAAGTDYTFTYTVITGNNCTNTQQKTIKVLPSPKAIFSVLPQCDTALIAYQADPSTNLASTVYTWALSDSIRTGQNVEHRFPGVSTYSVQLKVEHPAYLGDPLLVCSDSLRLDQIVGPYPRDIDFKFFNVCEADDTNFEVTSSIPISRVSWDFGDGEITALGVLSDAVTGPSTSGTYQQPVHKYSGAADQVNVIVRGRTSESFGGCEITAARDIAILKKWAPSLAEPSYDMSKLNNGNGFWVVEDKQGNASWEFNTATKPWISTDEMTWVTGQTDPYNPNDVSYVNSPCFDLSTFTRPVLSIQHWTDTEPSDGAVLQYSVDGGENWTRLGDVASGLDWYNRLTISANPGEQPGLSSGWSQTNQEAWAVGKHTLDVLPLQRNQVRFRVAFSSFNNREGRDGFAFNNVVIEERNRTILIENFTNLNPAQTQNNTAFKNFRTTNGTFNVNELVKLQYHHASVQNTLPPDELHLDNPVDQNARAGFYGVLSPVKAFVDGSFGQTATNPTFSSTELDTYFGLRSLVTSPVAIAIDFEADPADPDPDKTLNVKATVQATDDLGAPGHYNVFIAIAEQEILGQVYVLRKLLPSASGTPLTSLSATDPAQEIYATYDMRHVTRLQNGDFAPFAVIAFVQHLETKDVLQTTMRQDGTASSGIVTGVETTPDNYIRLYPNPADDRMNIILPAPVKEVTHIKLFDTFGKQVFNGTFKTGEHIKTIETKTFSGGVYLLQLLTHQGLVLKKALVVHE